MKRSVRYLILAALLLGIFTTLMFTVSAPLIYSLEQDFFVSRYHDNTEVLKLQQLNSTTDLLPLMQDLMDYSGTIVLNINIKDMDQVRRDLALFAKYRKNLDNLVIKLDMDESEIDDFSKSSERQRMLLAELMNASISLDELKQLEIQYRDENNPKMLVSVILQQEAIRKKLKEIYGQYEIETEKIETISKKYNLDTSREEESLTEFRQIIESNENTAPIMEIQPSRVPILSLQLRPETGQYLDSIDFSGTYSTGNTVRTNYPVVLYLDNSTVASVTSGEDGIFHASYQIEHTLAGTYGVFASSGTTTSEVRKLTVKSVNSVTSLTIEPVYNRPEILCSGEVIANRPVKNAPVDIIVDFRNLLRQTTNNAGAYQTRIPLSPGIHRIQSQFVNTSYPLSSSKSQQYEIEASRDAILSIRLMDTNMSADELSIIIDPVNASYKDSVNIRGILSGRNVRQKNIDLFIDDTFHTSLLTGSDGTYADRYTIEKIRAGIHTVFARYIDPGVGEIYSESHQLVVNPVDSLTSLTIEMTDGGTGLVCKGNVTANEHGVSSAPLELVWDDRNIITIQTDGTGSFRQQVVLPVGNHSIYAWFTSWNYPINSSRSSTYPVTIVPPLDLYVQPGTVQYMDMLTIGGSIHGVNTSGQEVQIFIDGKKRGSYQTNAAGNYSTQFPVEKIPGGTHSVYASYRDHTSELESFTVLSVNSTITLSTRLANEDTQVICTGQLRTTGDTPVRSAPVTIIWDSNNQVVTTTDDQGIFEETLSLPSGGHQIIAQFDKTDLYPIQPSISVPIDIEIQNPITLRVQPDRGMYHDIVTINGEIRGTSVSGQKLQMFIDGRKIKEIRSDSRGNFTTPYLIEQIRGGLHTIQVSTGDIRSDAVNVTVIVTSSNITLSSMRIDETSRVFCSGTVTANNNPVRFAPVVLVWDEKNTIRTSTDERGNYNETIVLPAGKHSIKAQFSSIDTFPINPSESVPVEVEIPLPLLISIQPNQGRYMDMVSIQGSLHTDMIAQQEIQIIIDGKLAGSTRTDNNGYYTFPYTLEKITGGNHSVYARNKEVSSEIGTFTVLLADSATTLSARKTVNSSHVICSGTVTANNRPVRLAPVILVWDEKNSIRTITDINGKYNETIVLPAGKHSIKAQFNSTDTLPLNPSESPVVIIEIPQIITIGNLVLELMPKEGKFMDHIIIRGILSNNKQILNVGSTNAKSPVIGKTPVILENVITNKQGSSSLDITNILTVNKKPQVETRQETSQDKEISGRSVSISIDGKLQGTYLTNNNGEFFTEFIIEEIRAGLHTVYAISAEIQSQPETFTVLAENSNTTLSAVKIGNTSRIFCFGSVMANNKPVRFAQVSVIWDDKNSILTTTDEKGNYNETIVLPPGKHLLKARFNSPDIYPLYPSESAPVELEIPLPLGFTVQPQQGSYLDILYIQGALHTEIIAEREIQIFIDGKSSGTYRTDRQGTFTIPYTIEKITGGQHIVYVRSGDIQTDSSTFTVISANTTTTLSAVKIGETSLVSCTGTVIANNNLVKSAPVTLIWDNTNQIRTITDANGNYNETIALPAGRHLLKAQFNSTNVFPLYPSESAPVEVEILAPLSVTVQPSIGKYRDILAINGSLHADSVSNRDIRLFIDDKQAGTYQTDSKGLFATPYSIEKITGGSHTLQAIAGNLKSNITHFFVVMDNSTTTLSAQRTGITSQVIVSGSVTTNNRSVITAPVTITWDGTNSLETITDNNGVFKDSINLPAGMHQIQARFNNTDIFPVNPSNSAVIGINISPGLSLDVRPASVIYKETIIFEGTLIRPDNLEGEVDLFVDNNFLATSKTDRTGRYSYTFVIEQMAPGKHTVQARSADLSSDVRAFTVLPAHSLTTLTITPVNNSALFECNGTVMAFDQAGDLIQIPLSIRDVLNIIAAFGKNPLDSAKSPVRSAPVALVLDNETLLVMETDAAGRFSSLVAFPPGDHVVTARFINQRYPLLTSQSKGISLNIPLVNTSPLAETRSSPAGFLVPVVIAGILLLFVGGSVFYLKRQSILSLVRKTPAVISTEQKNEESSAHLQKEIDAVDSFLASVAPPDPDMISTDPVHVQYIRVLHTQGLSSAARTVYVHFSGTIAQRLKIRGYRALTPREFQQSCSTKSYAGAFATFVTVYEQVRYGGMRTPAKESEFEESVKKTDESLGGEDH